MSDSFTRRLQNRAQQIFVQTLREVEVATVIGRKIRVEGPILKLPDAEVDLSRYREVILIGLGKASLTMGAAVESLLGEWFTRGILVTDRRHRIPVKSQVMIGGHPTPDQGSLAAANQILTAVGGATSDTLMIFLISGGGSALVEKPLLPQTSLEDLVELNQLLVRSGLSIYEINVIRKHLSALKGGRLGFLARRSASVGLYMSDVNVGDIRSVASNPLLPDQATASEFYSIIERHRLKEHLPQSIASVIEERAVPELPADWVGEERTPLSQRILLLDNAGVVKAAARIAERQGFKVEIEDQAAEGHYRDVAEWLLNRLLDLHRRFPNDSVCLVSGGEVSCPALGCGVGGRNQEFVVYCATRLAQFDVSLDVEVLSCGTDGIDGNSNCAGAIACAGLATAARAHGLELSTFIQVNDSHSLLKQTGGLIFTGPTGNNVRDLRIMIARARTPAH